MEKRQEMIKADKLVYNYRKYDEEGREKETIRAVDGVSFEVEKGDFVAILGHNGSGKSTLAKHINALLTPSEGTLWVNGLDTREEENLWDVRQSAGMVFRIRTTRSSGRLWKRMWDSARKTWECPQRKSGNVWRRA